MDAERLLAGLDPEQRAAVVDPHRPLAILAPAGSGKTRVLTRRVAYLAATGGLDAGHVLCVAFTREAAGELRGRLARLGLRDLPAAGTFHAIALALLRVRWADRNERAPGLVDDRAGYLRRLFTDLSPLDATRLESELGWAKARSLDPAGYAVAARKAGRRPPAQFVERWKRYEDATRNARLVDFDDLLSRCADLFDEDPSFAAAQRWRFRHLFVDEFQDVNPAQFRLLRAWLGDGCDLTVVGDPGQAIYGWNGADASYLDQFCDHFGGAVVHELAHNHRSSPQVVAVADSLRAGQTRTDATQPEGAAPEVVAYGDEAEERSALVEWVRALGARGVPLRQQAVLVRTNALARRVAEALEAAGIPQRLLLPRGGRQRLSDLVPPGTGNGESLASVVADLLIEPDGASPFDHELLRALSAEYLALDPTATVGRFGAWLATAPATHTRSEGVTVATFHAAKGLEWRAVHVAAVEDGYVPVAGATTGAARAEERRLLYVALTRATEYLTCSWTRTRSFGDQRTIRARSPLLDPVAETCAAVELALAPIAPPPLLRPVAAVPVDDPASAAEQRLRDWRARQARAVRVLPAAILPDDVLVAVAASQPTSEAELAAIAGVGELRARRLASGMLAALRG